MSQKYILLSLESSIPKNKIDTKNGKKYSNKNKKESTFFPHIDLLLKEKCGGTNFILKR